MSPIPFDLSAIPAVLRGFAAAGLEAAVRDDQLAPVTGDPRLNCALPRLVACSPFAADLLVRYPSLLAELAGTGRLDRGAATGEISGLIAAGAPPDLAEDEIQRRLRLLRHRELLRIIWRDLEGSADITESLADLSALADAAIGAALAWARQALAARHGKPVCEDGRECGFGVIAMGKLGGRELNFSSDVDLIFAYSDAGETTGPRRISNEEYFRLLAQRLIDLLSRKTADGFVYRVDARLRPFGSAGPLAVSIPGLEAYLLQHGRDWERYAWIKARVVNDWADADGLYRDVLRPFIYRRYLDFGVFSSLRDMKALIEAEVQKKEFRNNLKLGPGGIREIEFIAQALQLVRGGTVAELRERELQKVLPRLVRHGCLPAVDVEELTAAYRFLRLAENRIQAMRDQQTHDLPAGEADQARLAFAMGHATWAPFAAALTAQQDAVARHFRAIVFRGAGEPGRENGATGLAAVWGAGTVDEQVIARLAAAGYQDPAGAFERLCRLRDGGVLRRLDEPGRQRLDALMPAVIAAAGREQESLRALDGMVLVIESIGRRSAYFALLCENPAALERLVHLCARSDFLARQVAAHPLLLDELLDPRVFREAPSRAELASDLTMRLAGAGLDDSEAWLNALRNFQQAAIFRVAVVDLSGILPLMKVSDRLTDIAELVLEGALGMAWRESAAKHGEPRCVVDGVARPARFAIVAYGKLGGFELGYSSDLDLVFLHDSAGDSQQTDGEKPLDNTVFFGRLTRRIMSILTMATTSGKLYEVDIRLRPSGRSGLLVSSLQAFDLYQRQDAWTWEHQALLRSRAVAGDPGVRAAFEELRVRALTSYIRRENLREEVLDMRRRMREELARGTEDLLDIKQDPGGITDIEFIVQYLVLRETHRYPDLVHWSDNIRQLEGLATHGILSAADAGTLADAYRSYRERLHHLSLAGDPGMVPRAEMTGLTATVIRLWQQVFA